MSSVQRVGHLHLRNAAADGTRYPIVQGEADQQTAGSRCQNSEVDPGRKGSGQRPVDHQIFRFAYPDVKAHCGQAAQTAAQDGEQQESLTFGRSMTKEKKVESFSDGSGDDLCGRQELSSQKALPI
jgi:hypothetical protein